MCIRDSLKPFGFGACGDFGIIGRKDYPFVGVICADDRERLPGSVDGVGNQRTTCKVCDIFVGNALAAAAGGNHEYGFHDALEFVVRRLEIAVVAIFRVTFAVVGNEGRNVQNGVRVDKSLGGDSFQRNVDQAFGDAVDGCLLYTSLLSDQDMRRRH